MKRPYILCALVALLSNSGPASAHFQMLIPSEANVDDPNSPSINLDIQFTHPMAGGPLMSMPGIARFGVFVRGEYSDLSNLLERVVVDGKATYRSIYRFDRPGDRVFVLEPAPYWEPAENTYIVHFTKVIVDGFGGGGGWDKPAGLPVEVVPLVQPYALWTGNTFRGVVLREGQPVSNARVEIEYLNNGNPPVSVPSASFETQVVRSRTNGEFEYTIPRAGWWGFAALVDGPSEGLKSPEGEPADMEWGGLIWVHAVDME